MEIKQPEVIQVGEGKYLGYKRKNTIEKAMRMESDVSKSTLRRFIASVHLDRLEDIELSGNVSVALRKLTKEEKDKFDILMVSYKNALKDWDKKAQVDLFEIYANME